MKKTSILLTIVIFLTISLAATSLINFAKADIMLPFPDGFESGSLSPNWTPYSTSVMTINQQTVHSGSYSVQHNSVGGDPTNLYYHTLSSIPNPIYMREYVYISSTTVPSTNGDYYEVGGFAYPTSGPNYGDGEICVFNVGGTLYWGLYVVDLNEPSGFSHFISTANTTATAIPVTIGWHSLELQHLTGTNSPLSYGEEVLIVDGQTVVDILTNNSNRTPGYVVIGGSQTTAIPSETWSYYIDDVAVGDSPIGSVQYTLTSTSVFGTITPPNGSYPDGTTLTITATPPTTVSGERYVFTGWVGTGSGSYTGTNNPASITMNAPITETATWEHQYQLTTTSAHGSVTPTSAWYDADTTTTVSLASGTVAGTTGTQYVFSSWSGAASGTGLTSSGILMNGPKAVTALWTTQYYLTTTSAHGTVTTSNPSGWYNAGTSATAILASSTAPGTTGVRYAFTDWGTDASGTGLTSNAITMNAPKTATVNWQTQYNLTFTQSGVGTDYTGNLVTVNGNNYDLNGYSTWANQNAVYTFSYSPQAVVSNITTQYLITGVRSNTTATSVTVSQPTTVNATYRTQYYLTVTSTYDSPSPTSAWYDNNTSINAYVSSPASGYSCSGWTGTGSVPASGSSSATTFTITAPSIITWNWASPATPTPTPTAAPTAAPTATPTSVPTASPSPTAVPTTSATPTPTNTTPTPTSNTSQGVSPYIYGAIIAIVIIIILIALFILYKKNFIFKSKTP
jgi:hypothetical protein